MHLVHFIRLFAVVTAFLPINTCRKWRPDIITEGGQVCLRQNAAGDVYRSSVNLESSWTGSEVTICRAIQELVTN